jgi:hypothetical protein
MALAGILMTIAAGLMFYWLRCRFRFWYGLCEIVVAIADIYLTFVPSANFLLLNEQPFWGALACEGRWHPRRHLYSCSWDVLRLVPTVPMTTTAATAISAAIKPYSIAVTPSSFSTTRHKDSRLRIIKRFGRRKLERSSRPEA